MVTAAGTGGFCVWLTGLSGAGKSTIARLIEQRLVACGRVVTMLDGDAVRTNLSQGLGFSKADRDTNVRRIGFVAGEIVRHGGAVICAVVSPYRATREEVRAMVGAGAFLEVFVDTPLAVCEARDPKGLYAKARRGELRGFTGIDDPYEPPRAPEMVLQASQDSAERSAERVMELLAARGLVRCGALDPQSLDQR